MLFDDKLRKRTLPLQRGEELFQFYDSRASTSYDAYRSSVNSWLQLVEEADRAELIQRLRSGDALNYHAAMAELIVHTLLRRSGYTVVCHPEKFHQTRRPDFVAMDDQRTEFAVVEVKAFGLPDDHRKADRIEDAVYNAIDALDVPSNCYLNFEVLSRRRATPPIGDLCTEVLNWVREVASRGEQQSESRIFQTSGWEIQIGVLSGFRERTRPGAIGIYGLGGGVLEAEAKIRGALDNKAKKYGEFDIPYCIAVTDCADQLTGGDENFRCLYDALWGDEAYFTTQDSSGEFKTKFGRRQNGFWGTPTRPKNRNVSAAILLPSCELWKLRDDKWQPIIFSNPFAHQILPMNFLPLNSFSYDVKGKMISKTGLNMGDVLGLPKEWLNV